MRNIIAGTTLKTWFWNGILAAVIALPALSGAAWAQSTNNDGCSNATLQGDYAFTIHGEYLGIVTSGPTTHTLATPIPIDGVAMTKFDGNTPGKLTQVDFLMRGGVPIDGPGHFGFDVVASPNSPGDYTVNTDCTGNFEIVFPNQVVILANFVLASQGREIRTVYADQVVPDGLPFAGVTCDSSTGIPTGTPAGCPLLVQIRSDGIKLQPGLGTGDSSGTGLGTGIPSVR